ncbi:unnamed protein product [Heterobilharzia americana]|nr:unnamed protein product [Heterobilharzia americana]
MLWRLKRWILGSSLSGSKITRWGASTSNLGVLSENKRQSRIPLLVTEIPYQINQATF